MAFWDKYKVEISDVYGLQWNIEIQEDSASGSTTYLTATGSPLRFDFFSGSDEYNEPIRPSKAIFEVYSTTNFALTDFYTDEDFRLKVNIKYGSTLYWTGFIITSEYSEPYNDTPYPVTITAVDGLNYLKDILYDDSGTYYDGRKRISKIVLDILAKINITSFTEYLNIYEEEMADTADDSPMDQSYLDVDIFRDMSCYEVLQAILEPFNAVIRQRNNGIMVIYRPEELTQTTVYGRTFTGETTKSSTSLTPAQYIERTTETNLKQLSGGALMIKGALKKITANQDFGYKESWIDNWEFKGETFDGTDFEGWTQQAGTNAAPISSELGEGADGVYLGSYDTSAPNAYYIEQSFAPYAVEDLSTNYGFEFEYLVHNTTVSDVANLDIAVQVITSDRYLASTTSEGDAYGDFAVWSAGVSYVVHTVTAKNGISGWQKISRPVLTLHGSGPITVRLYASNKTNVYVAFKNVKFYNYSEVLSQRQAIIGFKQSKVRHSSIFGSYLTPKMDAIYGTVNYASQRKIVRKTYEATNALNGKELAVNYIIGDVINDDVDVGNIVEQFAGSIGKPGFDYRVDTVTLTGGGAGDSADITCNGDTQACEFDTDLATTAAKFVTDHAAQYASSDVTVTSSGADIIFTNDILGEEFNGATTIVPDVGTLDGTVALTTPARPDDAITQTEVWNTRSPGGEAQPLLEIITAEIGGQHSRPKHLIQMNIAETLTTAPVFNIIGNLQDSLNTISGNNRKFVVNSAQFDVKQRLWNVDLIEIIS